MRRIVVWGGALAVAVVLVAVAGALLVDAPMPGRPAGQAVELDCDDREAVERFDAEAARQRSLGLRPAERPCG